MRTRFLDALHGRSPDTTPIWLMRQAGRYLPGYRKIRKDHEILEIVRDPKLAAEVSLEPLRRFDLDAGIVFSDIVVPLVGMGLDVRIDSGIGPVIGKPVRTREGLQALPAYDAQATTGYVGETIRRMHEESDRPVLGFAASPFTLACYLIEGQHVKDFPSVRTLIARSDDLVRRLVQRLTSVTLDYLRMQERAGADALQLFDTWAGLLSPAQYRQFVLPELQEVMRSLGKPVIYFSTSSSHLLPEMRTLGATALSVDWRLPLSEVRRLVGDRVTLQGNLDPAVLLCPREVLERKASEVLQEMPRGGGRYVFNLGHGVLPETEPARVKELVEFVHKRGAAA